MKFCKNCGTQMEDAIVYCPQCGAASEQPQQQAYQQQAYQQPQQPQQQAYQQQTYQQQAYQQQAYQQPYQPYQPYQQPVAPRESGLATVAKIFMIIGTVAMGLYLIPLAWCIPMTMSYWKKLKTGEPVSVGFKICTLLFVNTIAGILMLCDKDH